MFENVAWNTFESTGNIEAYMFYRELEQDQIQNEVDIYAIDRIDKLNNISKACNQRA